MPVPATISPVGVVTRDTINGGYGPLGSLATYQFSYGGNVFGLSQYGVNWKEIDGLDIENMRFADSNRPRDHGQFIGYDFLTGRDITLKFDVQGTDPSDLQTNMKVMNTATIPRLNQESPLWFVLPQYGLMAAMARPRNRSWKIDIAYSTGNLAQDNTVLFHATDPRFYTDPTVVALDYQQFAAATYVSSDSGSPGWDTDLIAQLENSGNFDCRPLICLTGPVGNPEGATGPAVNFGVSTNQLSGSAPVNGLYFSPSATAVTGASTTSSSATITGSFAGIQVGESIQGDGIPAYTWVQTIVSDTEITMSNEATATAFDVVDLTFGSQLTPNQTVVIDMYNRTIQMNDSVAQSTIAWQYALAPSSQWFTLLPNGPGVVTPDFNEITYVGPSSDDIAYGGGVGATRPWGATMQIVWSNAWLL